MKTASFRVLALVSLASLAMATSTNAAMVLAYGAGSFPGTKTASVVGTTTRIDTSSLAPLYGGAFPVNITTIGDIPLSFIQTIVAKETFVNVVSTGAATNLGGTISQPFGGIIQFTDPSNPLINFLTITFNGVLRGSATGQTVSLTADNTVAGQSVSFTSTDLRVLGIAPPGRNLTLDPIKSFEFGLTGLQFSVPGGLAIVGSGSTATIGAFTTTNESGNVSSFAIPEPAGIVMASTAVLAGLGCFGWRRSRPRSV